MTGTKDNQHPFFRCLKCGDCCRSLLGYTDEGRKYLMRGLSLLPTETELFRNKGVELLPYQATDARRHGQPTPTIILMYQMNKAVCPFLDGNNCSIYDHRPVVCRSYPLLLLDSLDRKCRSVRKHANLVPTHEMVDAYWEGAFRIGAEMARLGCGFQFDLSTKQWVRVF